MKKYVIVLLFYNFKNKYKMRIIKLLNTVDPEIYFDNIFEYLFGTIDYRVMQSFLRNIDSVVLYNSNQTGHITLKTMENKSFEIVCKKSTGIKCNLYENISTFKKKMNYIYETVKKFTVNSQYEFTYKKVDATVPVQTTVLGTASANSCIVFYVNPLN